MGLNIISRRHFLGRTAGLAAGAFTGPNLLLKGQNAAGKNFASRSSVRMAKASQIPRA